MNFYLLLIVCFGASSAALYPNHVRSRELTEEDFAKRAVRVKPAQTSSAKARLYAKLTSSQDPEINPDGQVNMNISMFIQCANLDKETNILRTQLYERFYWSDSRLSWNPEDFGGIKRTTINPTDIWTPNLRLTNSFMTFDERVSTTASVSNHGSVFLVSHALYTTLCSPSTTAADAYNCALKLESWEFNSATLNIELGDNPMSDIIQVDPSFLCPYKIEEPTAEIVTKSYSSGDYQTFLVQFTIRENESAHV